MTPIYSKIGREMRNNFEKLVNWYIFNFYLNREVKSTETNNVNDADHCLVKNCQ